MGRLCHKVRIIGSVVLATDSLSVSVKAMASGVRGKENKTIRLIPRYILQHTLVICQAMRSVSTTTSRDVFLPAAPRMPLAGRQLLTFFVEARNSLRKVMAKVASFGRCSQASSGLLVQQKNYLLVYTYDKWEGKHIPEFRAGERFMPTVCELREGATTSPKLLTEADLVALMDKNGIGQYMKRSCSLLTYLSQVLTRRSRLILTLSSKEDTCWKHRMLE